MKQYKKLLIALAACASLYIVRATGIDKGLIDDVLDAAIEALTDEGLVGDAPVELPQDYSNE